MRFEILATNSRGELTSVMIDADSSAQALERFEDHPGNLGLVPKFVGTRPRGPISSWTRDRLTIQNTFYTVEDTKAVPVRRFSFNTQHLARL